MTSLKDGLREMKKNLDGYIGKASLIVLSMILLTSSSTQTVKALETTTKSDPCSGGPSDVCNAEGNGTAQLKAIEDAFGKNRMIDLVLVICLTIDCRQPDNTEFIKVKNFISALLNFVSSKYNLYIDRQQIQVAIITYDYLTTNITFKGTEKNSKKVDSCQFDKIINNLNPPSANRSSTCKLPQALDYAKEIFGDSERVDAKKILWVFTDCRFCASGKGEPDVSYLDQKQQVETAIQEIKGGYQSSSVFVAGIAKCPIGFFDSLAKENLAKTIATSSSHFACIDAWYTFTQQPGITLDAGQQIYSERGESAEVGGSCSDCLNATSNYRCACNVISKLYQCHVFEDVSTPVHSDLTIPLTLALGVGIGVGLGLLVIIIIIIIVVVVVVACRRRRQRRCTTKPKGIPPEPQPRLAPRKPPARAPSRRTESSEYVNPLQIDIPEEEPVEYEILELEKNMDGWSSHLQQEKSDNSLLHLGVYSTTDDYFAQTPGFTLSTNERLTIERIMQHAHTQKESKLKIGEVTFLVNRKTLSGSSLSARSSDNTKCLKVAFGDGYLAVGIAESKRSNSCQDVVHDILKSVLWVE